MAKTSSHFAPEQLDASAERALQFAHQAGPDAPALVSEWIKVANAAAVHAVAELGQGLARKAARRGLNVLKARGVTIPQTPRTSRLATGPDSAPGEARQAWLLPPDSSGTEGLVLAERQPSGSYQACFVFFRHGQNIVRVQSGTLGLSKIKESMQQSLGGAGYAPVNVPWAWAQYRIADRRAWHTARNTPEPLGMMGTEKFLQDAPAVAPTHPFDEEGLELGDEDAEKLARGDSGVLHQWPEFRSWLPGERAIQELLVHLGRRLGPQPPTSKEELDPIVREQVAAATDRYFTPERRAVLANRMKDSGLSVLSRLGEHAALQVAAVIHVIQGAGLITNPPSDVKFLTSYFDKALALLAAQQGGQLRIPIPRAAGQQTSEEETAEESAADELPVPPAPPEAQQAPAPAEGA
jgi:hypothetical protein